MVKLDRMAQAAYSHLATYQNDPLPNISLARLREKMKDSEPVMDKDNSIDYGYRNFNFDYLPEVEKKKKLIRRQIRYS